MDDALERLRETPGLLPLLAHYGRLGTTDREAWQDRLMELEGVPTRDLVRLHGELLAFGLVQLPTGSTASCKPAVVASCYRITVAGQRALRRAEAAQADHEDAEADAT
jgi:hypothetical protein